MDICFYTQTWQSLCIPGLGNLNNPQPIWYILNVSLCFNNLNKSQAPSELHNRQSGEWDVSLPLRFLFVSLFVPFLIFSRVSFSCFKLFCFSRKIRRSLSSSSGCTRHPFSLFARLSFSGCFILNLTPGTPLCPEALSLPLLYVQRFLLDPRHAARTPFFIHWPPHLHFI